MNRNLTFNNIHIFKYCISVFSLIWFNIAPAADTNQAALLVETTTNRMLDALKQQRSKIDTNPNLIYDIANNIAVPHFDFEQITQNAMGKFWRQANTPERSALIEEFKTLLVRTYAKSLLNYSGQEIRLLSSQPGKSAEQVKVKTVVDMPGGNSIPINYLLYLKNEQWKAYDVVINGVSLVANYRNSFAQEIRRGGISNLINALKTRNHKTTK